MKKEVIIGILAVAVVIAGCTQQVRESSTPTQISKQTYGGTDYQGVLNMLRDTRVIEYNPWGEESRNCYSVCYDNDGTCIHAEYEYMFGNPPLMDNQWIFAPITCENEVTVGHNMNASLHCWCANPPQ